MGWTERPRSGADVSFAVVVIAIIVIVIITNTWQFCVSSARAGLPPTLSPRLCGERGRSLSSLTSGRMNRLTI